MVESIGKPPERVLSKVQYGFTVDLNNAASSSLSGPSSTRTSRRDLNEPHFGDQVDGLTTPTGERPDALEILKQLNAGPDGELRASDIASRALSSQRECMGRRESDCEEPQTEDPFDKILEATRNQEALMTFYYKDENDKVKMTEIFSVPDSTSTGLSTPENELMEWDSFAEGPDSTPLQRLNVPGPVHGSDQVSAVDLEDGFRLQPVLIPPPAVPVISNIDLHPKGSRKERRKGRVMLTD
jgi:hypothetical protein